MIPFTIRHTPVPQDVVSVRRIVEGSRFFSPAEVEIACELVATRLEKGTDSGYEFVFLDEPVPPLQTIAYACFGEIPCTVQNYDLYWIVVDKKFQAQGLGGQLLRVVEAEIRNRHGRQIYVDTAGRDQYSPTRQFYERNGYFCAAILQDFYAPGDAKHVYVKNL